MMMMRCLHLTQSCSSSPRSSPTSRSWCYPQPPRPSASVFLSFFSLAPPSLSCLHILLFSIHAHTTSTYFPVLSWIFLPPSLSLYFFHSLFCSAWRLHSSILTSSFPPHPTSLNCAFFTAHVSAPYIIAWSYNRPVYLPLTLTLILRAHRTTGPRYTLPVFHHSCTQLGNMHVSWGA